MVFVVGGHTFRRIYTITTVPICKSAKFICYSIFTTRKRSLRRLCFYRCLFVHRGGGRAWLLRGACVVFSGGVCMVFSGGGVCMVFPGGMHGFFQGVGGVCVFFQGGMCGFFWRAGVCVVFLGGMHGFFQEGGMRGFFWGGLCGFSGGPA